MSNTPMARNGELGSLSRRPSPTPDSPRKRLRNGDGAASSGHPTPALHDLGARVHESRFEQDTSIVLVGIRGCGKRSLGFIAAAALGRRFITEDHYFQTVTGFSRQDYLRIHGSEEFHKQDVEVSRRMLEDNKQGCVIDCGLGSLTRALQEHLKAYSRTHPVIYIQRDMASIKQLLKLSDKSAVLLENGDQSHRRCSNFEFYNMEENSQADFDGNEDDRASPTYSFKLRSAQVDFSRFVSLIFENEANLSGTDAVTCSQAFSPYATVESKLFTHSLCLPITTYRNGLNFTSLEAGGDVAEVNIDEWQEGTARLVSRLVAEVRRRLGVPIMISVMPVSDRFPLNMYFTGIRHAFRLIPEFLCIDLVLERNWIADLAALKCHRTRLIGTIRYDQADRLLQESEQVIRLLEKALGLGITLVRVTASAAIRSDGERFDQFIRALKHRYASRLWFSAYLTGPFGRTSQVFNPILTSVSHEMLKAEHASYRDMVPDITSYQALKGLFSSYTLDPLHFYVFGANVSSSLSPAMHNNAYKALGLPHDYAPVNVDNWENIRARAQAFDFGGASIAQPWKVKILEHMSHLSGHARAIGAINTLIPLRGEHGQMTDPGDQAIYRNRAGFVLGFYGDNSDWVSIKVTLNKNLSPRNVIHNKTSALIVGAGGMARAACYALLQAGCRNIFIYNRTISNAEVLAEHFLKWSAAQNFVPKAQLNVLRSINDPWPEGFAQPSIIISCVTHERLHSEEHVADFIVPEQWLLSETGGAAVEQAYYINTPFIKQVRELHARTGKPWVVVDGLEVLHEQAVAQFEIMTGRKAPRTIMWNALKHGVIARDGKV